MNAPRNKKALGLDKITINPCSINFLSNLFIFSELSERFFEVKLKYPYVIK